MGRLRPVARTRRPGPAASGGGGRKGLFIGGGVLVALLAVIAYFLFSGGTSSASTPTAAVTKLLEAGKTLDVKKAKSVLCEASKSLSTFATPTATDRVTSYKVGAVTQTDANHATVSVTVTTTGQGTSQTESIPVKKEGGSWKVCPTDALCQPAVVAAVVHPVRAAAQRDTDRAAAQRDTVRAAAQQSAQRARRPQHLRERR